MRPLHPLWLRIWHWVNAALVLFLLLTGLQLSVAGLHIFPFEKAVLVHKVLGYAMIAGFLFWLAAAILDGSLARYYRLRKRDVTGILPQARYYAFGIFRGEKAPFPSTVTEKFNPLQKLSYIAVQFVFTPIIAASGILFSDIVHFRRAIDFIGGLPVLDAIHGGAAYVFACFLIVHIYMATMGRTPFTHIKEMLTGRADE
jgi:thiosulfate reductase cytochrome b subunit